MSTFSALQCKVAHLAADMSEMQQLLPVMRHCNNIQSLLALKSFEQLLCMQKLLCLFKDVSSEQSEDQHIHIREYAANWN